MRAFVFLCVATAVLGGAPDTPESAFNDAGYISVHNEKHNLFYWYDNFCVINS